MASAKHSERLRFRSVNRLEAIPSDWQLPANDIDECIDFSRSRCVFSLISLFLLATDIPRTGLGIKNVYQYFPNKEGPSVAVYFGPWAYPVAHIWQNTTSSVVQFAGAKGTNAINTAKLWSYKYDTTSIGLRGIGQLLHLPAQYREPPGDYQTILDLATTYTFLDNLASKVQDQLSAQVADDTIHPQQQGYFAFETQHFWIDRLHHYLYRFTKANTRWRMHSVFTYKKHTEQPAESLNICSSVTRARRPIFCDRPVRWMCTHPINASRPKVPISDHIDLRLLSLQRKHPGLRLDLTVFTTFNPSTSSTSGISAYFQTEVLEIVMLTRGQNCSVQNVSESADSNVNQNGSIPKCRTVFVDDYRYERSVIESNISEWYPFTATLRGIAQLYVWIRLVLLFAVTFHTSHDRHPLTWDRLVSTLKTLSKIPFQVVVYGSLFPVVCYVLAHYIDCSFVDVFLETYWTTVNGTTKFDIMTFIRHASLQMRNVWILALFMKAMIFFQTHVLLWRPHNGIQGVRGLAISLSCALSVFGPYRSLAFRDTSILATFTTSGISGGHNGGNIMSHVQARSSSLFNVSMEGFAKDMKMTLMAVWAVLAIAIVLKAIVTRLRPGSHSGVLFRSSIIVPYSAGLLWPTTALSACFRVSTARPKKDITPSLNVARVAPTSIVPNTQQKKRRGGFTRATIYSRHNSISNSVFESLGVDNGGAETNESSLHDCALRFETRTREINSIVRLMNIAMMTDPWTYARLRVLGVQVYFYESTQLLQQRYASMRTESVSPLFQPQSSESLRTQSSNNRATLHHIFLLPCSPEKILEWTGYGSDEYRLVGIMSSRDLPWSVLLQCG